ncbi:MAG: transcriptional regulator DegA [Armatimonadaceae bacterium]
MRVTLREIADKSGVSVQTVSQILNEKGHLFRPDTRDRVLQAARDLRYRPNAHARATRSGQTSCIALLLSENPALSLLTRELLDGICAALNDQEKHLALARFPDSELSSEGKLPKLLREWMSDGLLINYNAEIPEQLQQVIRDHHIPAVWINSVQEADCVFPDDFGAAQEATQYLCALGHTQIAFVDYQMSTHYSRDARIEGYLSAIQAYKLEPQIIAEFRMPPQDDLDRADWLECANRPTAVLCYGPETVRLLIHQVHSKGLRIPDDLSIMTFSAEIFRSAYPLGFDAMMLPHYEMGQIAVEKVLAKIANPDLQTEPCAVPMKRHYAGTTQPLR